ncbi:hypothetical protein BKA70DRAFT_1272294 [Coprinopsis sp. MPI-PUGE-AT-0042]|nr:hypothetical protein BKA70DRAFT_1272294 [Coprinopsis sp. MPI-PUGE-AT-0042]
MPTLSASRPFLAYYESEEESSTIIRSIAPSPPYPPGTPGHLSSTEDESDSDDLGSAYHHHRPPHYGHPTKDSAAVGRAHHGNRGRNGLGAPTLSIKTANATLSSGQSRDANLDALRHSLDAIPACRLREIILQVAFSNPRFQRAVQRELQAVDGSLIGNDEGREDITAMEVAEAERKVDHTAREMTTTPKKRAPYVLQTPPITPITPRSSNSRMSGLTTREAKEVDVEEEETQRGRPSWRAFRGCRLVKEGKDTTTPRKTRRHRRALAGAGDQPQSFSDGHVERRNSRLFDPSDSSATTGRRASDNGNYHPGYLRDEAYEFVSQTPDGAAYRVVRNITMWSCCDEDEPSPGCVRSFFAASQRQAIASTPEPVELERPDTPDSDVMQETPPPSRPISLDLGFPAYEDLMDEDGSFSVFGMSKLPELDTMHSVSTLEDAYPDSDLESPYSSARHSPARSLSKELVYDYSD